MLSHYDIVIFDCDGVLLDTNYLKIEAFGKAVEEYPLNIVDKFKEHCKLTFGISRYIKFKEFFSDFAKEPFDENKYNHLLNNYASLCSKLYTKAEFTPGSVELLSRLNCKNRKLFVASGSDEIELRDCFQKRNISKYFCGIYGSPKTKNKCIEEILLINPNKSVVFIGDSLSDMNSAIENRIDFIYMSQFTVQSKEQDEQCRNGAKITISSLIDLLN